MRPYQKFDAIFEIRKQKIYFDTVLNVFSQDYFANHNFSFDQLLSGKEVEDIQNSSNICVLLGTNTPVMCFGTCLVCQVR